MDGVVVQQGHYEPSPSDLMAMLVEATKQLDAARYYVHKLRAHQYAVAVLNGQATVDQARARYDEAMRNYDSMIQLAPSGHGSDANAAELAKGSEAVVEAVEQARRHG